MWSRICRCFVRQQNSPDEQIHKPDNTNPGQKNQGENGDLPTEKQFFRYLGGFDDDNHRQAKRSKRILVDARVSEIPKSAFASCSELESVICEPDGILTIIQDGAFSESSISSIIIPSSVEVIGLGAFQYCNKLTNVKVHDIGKSKLRTIGDLAFYQSPISTIEIPCAVEVIGQHAFDECIKLTEVKVYDIDRSRLKTIGDIAFSESSISSIVIPSSVEVIGEHAFSQCCKLSDVKVHDIDKSKLKTIGEMSFYQSPIPTIIIPCSVEVIGQHAFDECIKLTNVKFQDIDKSKLKQIGDMAFSESSIYSIDIPSSVEVIGRGAFDECMMLTEVKVQDIDKSNLKQIGEMAFSESFISSIIIPSSVEVIGRGAFQYCNKLTNVKVHDIGKSKLKTIGDLAFYKSSLSSIDIPCSIEVIGNLAFQHCNKLSEKKVYDIDKSKLKQLGENECSEEIKSSHFYATLSPKIDIKEILKALLRSSSEDYICVQDKNKRYHIDMAYIMRASGPDLLDLLLSSNTDLSKDENASKTPLPEKIAVLLYSVQPIRNAEIPQLDRIKEKCVESILDESIPLIEGESFMRDSSSFRKRQQHGWDEFINIHVGAGIESRLEMTSLYSLSMRRSVTRSFLNPLRLQRNGRKSGCFYGEIERRKSSGERFYSTVQFETILIHKFILNFLRKERRKSAIY